MAYLGMVYNSIRYLAEGFADVLLEKIDWQMLLAQGCFLYVNLVVGFLLPIVLNNIMVLNSYTPVKLVFNLFNFYSFLSMMYLFYYALVLIAELARASHSLLGYLRGRVQQNP